MVETKGTELQTPTLSSNRSLVLESGRSNPRLLRSTLKKQPQDGVNALRLSSWGGFCRRSAWSIARQTYAPADRCSPSFAAPIGVSCNHKTDRYHARRVI